jgi:hypothetical protein
LLRLFCLNYDFGNAWYDFGNALNDATRQLNLSLDQDRFPYWVKRLGMDDQLIATFAVVDQNKHKLSIAPSTVTLAGDATNGWTLNIDQNAAVFPFLKKYKSAIVHMAIAYVAKS